MISPCILQCRLVDDCCVSCKRHRTEITNWTRYTDEERSVIMKRLYSENSDYDQMKLEFR